MLAGERLEQGEHARHQIDTGGDHGGGVHQRRDGCGPRHGVGEPHMERELGALPHRPEEEEDGADEGDTCYGGGPLGGGSVYLLDTEGAERGPQDDGADGEPDVGDPVGVEGLHARRGVGLVLPVVADQQVRGHPDAFPTDDQLDEVGRRNQQQHRPGEEGERRPEEGVPDLAAHVPHGEEEHEETDNTDDEEHHDRQAVDQPSPLQGEGAHLGHGHAALEDDALGDVEVEQGGPVEHDETESSHRQLGALAG